MKRAVIAAGLVLALVGCGTSQAAEPPAKQPPATIYTTQWTAPDGYPESWFECWTLGHHTWIGPPSQIPGNAVKVRTREDCEKP